MGEAMKVKSVRMPESVWERMDAVSARLGLSRSDLHRRMLDYALEAFEGEIKRAEAGPLGAIDVLVKLNPSQGGGGPSEGA